MKRLFTTVSLILLMTVLSLAQAPDTLWTKVLGDTSRDGGSTVIEKDGGGFIVCGSKGTELVADAYTTDIWIINTDENGTIINENTYEGMGSVKIIPTSDNGFMLLANTFTPTGSNFEDIILIKLNSSGDTIWTKTFNLMWSDYGREIHETPDDGFLVLFRSTGNPNGIRIFRTDSFGDTLWTKTYNTSTGSVQLTDDNGFVFLGYNDSTWISKEDSSGNVEWIKSYSGEFSGREIIKTSNPGYYVVGQTYPDPFGPPQDIGVMKINENGDSVWFQSYSIENLRSFVLGVSKTSSSELIISGATSVDGSSFDDGLIFKLADDGELMWTKIIGGMEEDMLLEANQLIDGTYISIGSTSSFGAGESDLWLIKTTPDVSDIEQNSDVVISNFDLLQNYPNPFNPSTTITFSLPSSSQASLKIFNDLGEEVSELLNKKLMTGTYEIEWDAAGLPSGIYFYQLRTEGFVETKKMILMK